MDEEKAYIYAFRVRAGVLRYPWAIVVSYPVPIGLIYAHMCSP